jgi:hypothetical protein
MVSRGLFFILNYKKYHYQSSWILKQKNKAVARLISVDIKVLV